MTEAHEVAATMRPDQPFTSFGEATEFVRRRMPDESTTVIDNVAWELFHEQDDDEPFQLGHTTPELFRLLNWRPPGTPAAPHCWGPSIGVDRMQLGPTGREALG